MSTSSSSTTSSGGGDGRPAPKVMRSTAMSQLSWERTNPQIARLHIYKLNAALLGGVTTMAGMFTNIKGTAYHTGLEVFGVEWCYGASDAGSGVAAVMPGRSHLGTEVEVVEMGRTLLSVDEVIKIIKDTRHDWMGPEYHILKHNCHSYCEMLRKYLKIGKELPDKLFELQRSAQESLGPRMMDMLFGDVEAAGAGMSAPDDDNPLSKESMEEAFGFMRNVAEEWNREDEERRLDKAKLKLAIYAPFAPGQVRHGPGKIHFAAQIQTTIQRLRRLQTTVHAYRRQEILP